MRKIIAHFLIKIAIFIDPQNEMADQITSITGTTITLKHGLGVSHASDSIILRRR